MNDNERGPHGRLAMGAGILLALLILNFPGVPGALAQEARGDPSELDEDDEDSDAWNEDEEYVGEPGDLDDDIVHEKIGDPGPTEEEDDEPGDDSQFPPPSIAAPITSEMTEDDDELTSPAGNAETADDGE